MSEPPKKPGLDPDSTPIELLLFSVMVQQSDAAENRLRSVMREMSARDALLAEARRHLAELRGLPNTGAFTLSNECKLFFDKSSLPVSANSTEANIRTLEEFVANELKVSSIDMMRLQSTMHSYNQLVELMSNIMKTNQELQMSVIRNIR